MITLRPYQQECIDKIQSMPSGSYLIQMATGLGKTVTFSRIPRKGRMLIISHREELVRQPLKYFDCMTGVEMASERAVMFDEVVSASVQSLARRLGSYQPKSFDIIITDEAHHAAATTYRKIYDYFRPRLHLGFTATPGRGDKVRLDDIYSEIIFQRDLRWGIQHNYLSDIFCRRVNIGYDLTGVKTSHGDYAPGELDEAMDGTADAIAEAYAKLATGATLIFAVSVHQAEEITKRIPGAVCVTGNTPNRSEIVADFTAGKIPCIVSVMVFTEGTDIPRVETIIIARPTQSDSLYSQMVGRGLRMFPGKKHLNLIDCVGITGRASLCTAPTLLGIDMDDVPAERAEKIEGLLFELPDKVERAADCPESWIKNVKIVDLWAKEQGYSTHDINFFKMPDMSLVCKLKDRKYVIPPQDELGMTMFRGIRMPMQQAIDATFKILEAAHDDQRYIWDKKICERWGKAPASDKQLNLIKRKIKGFDTSNLNKLEASQILNRLYG